MLSYGFDFDNTLTADPDGMSQIVRLLKSRGHRVYCVTARRNTVENVDLINQFLDLYQCQMPILLTGLMSKLEYVRSVGIKIDIWVDDDPTTLVHGH